MSKIIVAIDGPAASGKSTVAKNLAKKLNITYLSSGSIYRAIAYICLSKNIKPTDDMQSFLNQYTFSINKGIIFVNSINYTPFISLPETEKAVSLYASLPIVRTFAVKILRNASNNEDIIMDGRDIGTVVFPDAKYKFFLTASPEIRAKRRYEDFKKNHPKEKINLPEILNEIIKRDVMDQTREFSPLKKAEDAILIDNSKLNIEETIQTIYNYIHERQE